MSSEDAATDTPLRQPPATIHVDLDGAADIYEGHGWRYPFPDDPVFESGLRNFLNLCDETGIRATLFVIARSLDDPRKRALVEEAVRRGHEIASHSLTHKYLPDLDTVGKRREIRESREVLERLLGVPVRGFRAPGYRINRESIELLAANGYDYDASAFPTAAFAKSLRLSVATLSAAHRPLEGSNFVEWSMPDHRPSPIPFNPSYSLLLGNWYFDWALTRFRRRGTPLVLLFHLIDLADPLPDARLRGLTSQIYTLSILSAAEKLGRCRAMLDLVRRHYRILTTTDAIAEWLSAQPQQHPAEVEAAPNVR